MSSQKARKVRNPNQQSNKGFVVFIVAFVAIMSLLMAGFVWFQSRGPQTWSIADVETPDNLQVKATSEGNGQGQYLTFYTNENVDSIVSLFTDAQCPVCRQFENENGEDIATIVNRGDTALRVHMMSFLDENHGNTYSNLVSQAMGIVAQNDTPEVAWTMYNSMWEKRPNIDMTPDDMAETVKEMGASEDTVEKVRSIDPKKKDNVNDANIEALEQSVGQVGTPTVFINGVEQPNAMTPNFFKEILESGTPEESKIGSEGINITNLIKINVPEDGSAPNIPFTE